MRDHLFDAYAPCFIVGGGPSLKGFDFERLKGRQVLAINRAFQVLPDAQAIYFSDRRFWLWYREELAAHSGVRLSGKWPNAKYDPDPLDDIEYFEFAGREGLEIDYPLIRHGNNSGYAAINVAYHLGARTVVLMGFDMQRSKSGNSHWHDGYIKPARDSAWQKMLPSFPSIVLPAKAAGMTIINATDGGALDCFPRMSVDSFV